MTLPGLADLARQAAALPVGSGSVKVGLTLTPDAARAGLEYQQHFSQNAYAFAQGWAGAARMGGAWQLDYGAAAGVGFSW